MAHNGIALSKLFRPGIEGRYANVAGDSGGETFCGVARNYHPSWPGWVEVDKAKAAGEKLNGDSLFDRLLPLLQTFYRLGFWNAIQGDVIQDQALADFLFACAVNMNTPQAIKLLQRAIGAVADGVLGPRTMAILNSGSPDILGRYAEQVRAFYDRIAVGEKAKFKAGWYNRVAAYVGKDGRVVA